MVTQGEEPDERPLNELTAIYTRVSSHEHRANLERPAQRLQDYCAAKGYQVHKVVNLVENDREDLLHDLVSVMYSFAARLYGQRRAKRKTEAIVAQLTQEGSGETG